MKDINPFSYKYIQNSIRNFRSLKKDDFNWYDEPGTYWFKPVFYFYRSTTEHEDSDINNEGLLHPSWLKNSFGSGPISDNPGGKSDTERKAILEKKFVTSAYNYLMRNDEEERAGMLKQFITLLSNIVSRSPWYFQEVGGLDVAVDHAEAFKDGKFVTDERKQITFTLLPDAVDDRVGTLIDLYRSVCYSWKEKKEIVPANLRKFDMGLYVHGSMIQNDRSDVLFSKAGLQGGIEKATQLGLSYEPDTNIVDAAGKYSYESDYTKTKGSSHVYFEFINCEIDLSSTKGGDSISNAEGSTRTYTLTISYDDCYINRYNDFVIGAIGDVLREDINVSKYGESIDTKLGRENTLAPKTPDTTLGETSNTDILRTIANRDNLGSLDSGKQINPLDINAVNTLGSLDKTAKNIVSSVESATIGRAIQFVREQVGGLFLGNLYKGSPAGVIRDITSGRIVSVGVNELNKAITGNNSNNTDIKPGDSIYTPKPTKQEAVKTLGSLYRSVGIVSNL